MRIKITFVPVDNKLILPIHYNHIIQGMIYHNLDKALAERYHDKGFAYRKRNFKLFTFSRLFINDREYLPEKRRIVARGPMHLWISAMETDFLESLTGHLLRKQYVVLCGQECVIACVETKSGCTARSRVIAGTLSPVTVYHTDDAGKTRYVSPGEGEFEDLIIDNLARKAKAYYRMSDEEIDEVKSEISVRTLKVDRKIVTYFKGVVIEAWDGVFELRLPEKFFALAYNAGLGAKNSQGFGMIKVVK